MQPGKYIALSVLLFFGGLSNLVHAFAVSPVHIEMSTVGRDGRATITATSHSPDKVGVDVKIVEIGLSEDGEIIELTSSAMAEEEFLVFPPQSFLEPYGSQNFRFQWVGDPELERSRTFMVTVAEVPGARKSQNKQAKAEVQLALAFAVIINVKPLEGKPEIVFERGDIHSNDAGGVLEATFRNNSNVHGVLAKSEVILTLLDADGIRIERRRFDASELQSLVGIGLLPPEQTRKIDFSLRDFDRESVLKARSAQVDVRANER